MLANTILMNKIILVLKREYLTRVRSKTFLLSTFLFPLAMGLLIFGAAYFSVNSNQKKKTIAVVNDPGYFEQNVDNDTSLMKFVFEVKMDSISYVKKGYDALLEFADDTLQKKIIIHSEKQLGLSIQSELEHKLSLAYERFLLQKQGIDRVLLDSLQKSASGAISIDNHVADENGLVKKVNAELNYGIGFGCGLLIYITMFIFGAMVMRGVMEEKTNRIAEVIISSVKPFQLMMGKILGIAAVGLTQLALWAFLIITLVNLGAGFLPDANLSSPQVGMENAAEISKLATMLASASQVNWPLILSCFIFYFLGGYLFYASLFAAVGSVVNEDPQEAQSFMLPISMPIIFGFIILTNNLDNPDSKIMVWASMIPFTSPIVMMGRIPNGVPMIQLLASMAFLVVGFLFTTWFAGKVYRTGILMYGKKITWKEMAKWVFRKS